jgi:hypothetical protein
VKSYLKNTQHIPKKRTIGQYLSLKQKAPSPMHLEDTSSLDASCPWGQKLGACGTHGNCSNHMLQSFLQPEDASNTQRSKASKVKEAQK